MDVRPSFSELRCRVWIETLKCHLSCPMNSNYVAYKEFTASEWILNWNKPDGQRRDVTAEETKCPYL
jgi:hypothetical protein